MKDMLLCPWPQLRDAECEENDDCPYCRIARGEATPAEIKDAQQTTCQVCGCDLTIRGGYYGTGMCGVCCTGESALLKERGETW
jgi:hypothetical protein